MKVTPWRYLVSGMTLGVISLASLAVAEGLQITPGLWEITTNNGRGGPPEVEQSCMTEPVFDPVGMMGEAEGCEVSNEKIQGNSVDYDIACVDNAAGGKAEGHFSFTVHGEQGEGQIDVTMSVGDQSMNLQYTMDAKRVGDC